jgi:hypothetical protein
MLPRASRRRRHRRQRCRLHEPRGVLVLGGKRRRRFPGCRAPDKRWLTPSRRRLQPRCSRAARIAAQLSTPRSTPCGRPDSTVARRLDTASTRPLPRPWRQPADAGGIVCLSARARLLASAARPRGFYGLWRGLWLREAFSLGVWPAVARGLRSRRAASGLGQRGLRPARPGGLVADAISAAGASASGLGAKACSGLWPSRADRRDSAALGKPNLRLEAGGMFALPGYYAPAPVWFMPGRRAQCTLLCGPPP